MTINKSICRVAGQDIYIYGIPKLKDAESFLDSLLVEFPEYRGYSVHLTSMSENTVKKSKVK